MSECAFCDALLQDYGKLARETGSSKEKKRLLRMHRAHEKSTHSAPISAQSLARSPEIPIPPNVADADVIVTPVV
jgi:hypothetical protein